MNVEEGKECPTWIENNCKERPDSSPNKSVLCAPLAPWLSFVLEPTLWSNPEGARSEPAALCKRVPLGLFSQHNWILSFSKDCRSRCRYSVAFLTPCCLKTVRIIVFLCKQRCEVNNTSGFSLHAPASAAQTFGYSAWSGSKGLFMRGNGTLLVTLYSCRKVIDQDMTVAFIACFELCFCLVRFCSH